MFGLGWERRAMFPYIYAAFQAEFFLPRWVHSNPSVRKDGGSGHNVSSEYFVVKLEERTRCGDDDKLG